MRPHYKILGVIPARYASTRFPAKSLVDIKGKSMIRRVYEQARAAESLTKVIVATDHQEIFDHVQSFGGEVCLTDVNHQSGTDRCYEVFSYQKENFDYIINIQGDEPFIAPEQIDLLASCFSEDVNIATLVKKINDNHTLFNPNVVKVVSDKNEFALFFSRETIPHQRGILREKWLEKGVFFKHIGIYGFNNATLKELVQLPTSLLEKSEALEQLRWLENGYKITTRETKLESIGIDTPEDLEAAISKFFS